MKVIKFIRTFIFILGLALLPFTSIAIAQSGWQDDFESYYYPTWPSTWIPDGNGTNSSSNFVDSTTPFNGGSFQGNNFLKLYGSIGGCWGALAYRPLNISAPFEIEVKIKNGDEALYGCHPDRAGIGLRMGTHWSNPSRSFIQFYEDGKIKTGEGTLIRSYSTLTWYTMKVRYERPSTSTVKLTYWIDGVYKGEEIVSAHAEEDQMTNFSLFVQEGTAWFDEVTVSPVTQQVLTWYQDFDDDGYGNPNVTLDASSQPSGYVSDNTDCDDSNLGVYPGATEIAGDGIDQDCDGEDVEIWYQDSDNDGFGNPDTSMVSIFQPSGYVLDNTDCDDSDPDIYPGAPEIYYDWVDQDCDGKDSMSSTVPYYSSPIIDGTNVVQSFAPAGNDVGKVGDVYVFTLGSSAQFFGDNVLGMQGWNVDEVKYLAGVNLSMISVSYDVNSMPKGTKIYIGYGVGSGNTLASMNSNATFVHAYTTVLDTKVWHADLDQDGYGNPDSEVYSLDYPAGFFVSDNTDCDDTDASVYPGATEIAGDGIDQDCDGSDLKLSGPEEIFLFSPSPFDSQAIGYGSSGGKVTFSFSKVADAAKYVLHFSLHDILADVAIPIPVELIPPGSSNPWGGGGGATPGFSEQFVGMVFELYLDSATWDVLALYDIEWGVEAYDSGGDLIGSTFSGSSAAKYVNSLKFMASNAIVMTSPVIGADLVKTDSAPVFKWDTYQGVSTYLVVLAHVGSLGFDVVIAEDNLTLNLFPMSDATWQSMPVGQWYWAVAGYDSYGNYNPSGFTIFDFEVSQ